MFKRRKSSKEAVSLWRRRHHRIGLFYVIPLMALFFLMTAYPILRSFFLSFFKYPLTVRTPGTNEVASQFVGFSYYAKLLTNPDNYKPFFNTLYFTAMFMPADALLALFIAILLNRIRRGSVLLRTMIFTPMVISFAVSSVMWFMFYQPGFGLAHGMVVSLCEGLNRAWGWFGGGMLIAPPVKGVLGEPSWAMAAIVLTCLWNGIGFNVILYLVGLQRIPDELYEAAVVDGAGEWRQFTHVTLPQLSGTTFLVLLLSVVGALKVFGQPYIMTGGGPADSTKTFVMRFYDLAFRYLPLDIGYASALAYSLAVFICVISLFVRKLDRPME